jgi:hypothetical protein
MINNFAFWIVLFVICFALGMFLGKFVKKSREEKIQVVKNWLLYAVAMAEKELGSGTGRIKLGQVYEQFLLVFPQLQRFISFDMFAKLVDDVLIQFQELVEENVTIAAEFTDTEGELVDIVEEPYDEEEEN